MSPVLPSVDHTPGQDRMQPPLPRAEKRIRVLHNDITVDHFRWLRDPENSDGRAYAEAENSYSEQATAHLAGLKAELIAEIEQRRSGDSGSLALQVGPFEYFQKNEQDLSHPRWWRRPVAGGPAELVLDPNAIPGSEIFYSLGVFEPSDDGRFVAFSFDVLGDELFELRVRDTRTGRDVWHGSRRVGMVAWAADGHTLFFTRQRSDRRVQRDQVVRVNVEAGDSEVIFEEADERLNVGIRRSHSGAWLFLDVLTTADISSGVQQQGAAEVWCLPANEPGGQCRRIVTRELGHKIYAEHWGDKFLFRVDDAGPYWRLVCAPMDDPSPSSWEEVVPHRAGVVIGEVRVLERHLVLLEREGINPRLVSLDQSGRVGATIIPDEPSCTLKVGLSAGGNYSMARHAFRGSKLTYSISSFLTPETIVEHDLAADRSTVLFAACVPGYDIHRYVATVVMAKANDGVEIPISVVAPRDRKNPGPMLLHVYGGWGVTKWPSFHARASSMTALLSLIDRGVSFGIVHVRGGGELGFPWHEAAVRDRKRTTYTDLIAAAEGLVEQGFASRDGIAIEGISAGGGAVLATAGLRPDLFRAVLAEFPFADILDSMLDTTMPFTLMATDEYGDPHVAQDFRYLRSYDPYYNLSADRLLPPTYVETALSDPQALWWQPARYVAQRRFCRADRDPSLIFRVLKVGGHAGASHGRSRSEEAALRIAWVLDQLQRSSAS
ncbi:MULTISPECIES: prolyl oligopeptidase family serine peptidase [Mesorhizobium]|uniref:prolyl oligopeptidase family serine peptidase n=1 Tax=Mesorhizobium TaxID=68287 RepID=UPI000BAE6C54|nr:MULTISPECIES: prolyl oligopeptidase family serine peptidase [Mesorhizobium]PBB58184.1 peptidase S9 [Mesorhizobium loti]PBB83389.1 peptidase S9 [Mesorhizobium sp. WSM3876]